MKAITYTQYGSPDVLQLTEVEKPTPKPGKVLVKIHAAAANPLDWHFMRGEPKFMRLENGIRTPKVTRLGADFAGVVEAVGPGVTAFRPGDAVFGDNFEHGLGSFAEYIAVRQEDIAPMPGNLSFVQAAAVPIAALTALQGLRDKGQIQAGQRVLINGASGGVGTFAVQIAKALGTHVTGVCSTRNLEMVCSIGADAVIDYTQEDFAAQGGQYDLIFDLVGNRSLPELRRALKPDGICSIAGFTSVGMLFQHMLIAPIVSAMSSQDIGLMGTVETQDNDLHVINDLIEAGQVTPVIDRCYPLKETADAIRYLETMRARGKVVITIVEE